MAQYTDSLGGGVADTGVSYKVSFVSSSDLVSPWNPTDTPNSGAFDSTGITASTVKPATVTTIRLRLGGTSVDGAGSPVYGNADPYIQLATQIDGGGGYTDDTIHHLTSSMITASTGTVNWAIDTNTTYYYGARGSTGTGSTLTFARGGSNGGIYFNGTLQSGFGNDGISGDVTVQHIPSAPGAPSTSNIGTTSLTLTWTAPTDNGGSSVTGYRINYKANTTSAWSVLVANTGSTTLSRTITTGLERNTKYDFQVAALNGVTDAHNTNYSSITAHVGVRSSTATATTLSGGPKIWTGAGTGIDGWSQSEIKIWTGVGTGVDGWTTGSTMKVWTGVGTGVDGWTNIT
jgi:hypothetical protein